MTATQRPVEPSALPSRSPLPLSASQNNQVQELYYKRVRGYCANEIRDFAACALNRTISATWACRSQRLTMNGCMIQHATSNEHDAAREEWFATMDERAKERVAKEKRKKEQEIFHKEWWGMPLTAEEEMRKAALEEQKGPESGKE